MIGLKFTHERAPKEAADRELGLVYADECLLQGRAWLCVRRDALHRAAGVAGWIQAGEWFDCPLATPRDIGA